MCLDAGVLKPRGDLSEAIVAEWSTEVQRLAQDCVTQADKATIVNAIRTYSELKHFMTARDRSMPPEKLDIRSFLDGGTLSERSTPCQDRASSTGCWRASEPSFCRETEPCLGCHSSIQLPVLTSQRQMTALSKPTYVLVDD